MWYAVYETETGRLRSSGSVVADPMPKGLSAKEFKARPTTKQWNSETLDFDVERVVPPKPISPLEFMRLFTVQERIAIRTAGDPVLDDFLDMARVAGSVRMDDQMVVQGLDYLVQQNIITSARREEIGGV